MAKYGLVDLEGNVLIVPEYDDFRKVDKGFKARKGKKIGLFDFDGKVIIPVEFTSEEYSKKYYALK